MVFITYYTELDLQICNYVQKRRICRENSKYALELLPPWAPVSCEYVIYQMIWFTTYYLLIRTAGAPVVGTVKEAWTHPTISLLLQHNTSEQSSVSSATECSMHRAIFEVTCAYVPIFNPCSMQRKRCGHSEQFIRRCNFISDGLLLYKQPNKLNEVKWHIFWFWFCKYLLVIRLNWKIDLIGII